jgi:hypothetical protein
MAASAQDAPPDGPPSWIVPRQERVEIPGSPAQERRNEAQREAREGRRQRERSHRGDRREHREHRGDRALWTAPARLLRGVGSGVEEITDTTGEAVDDIVGNPLTGAVAGVIIGHQFGSRTKGGLIGAVAGPLAGGAIEASGDIVKGATDLTADLVVEPVGKAAGALIKLPFRIIGGIFGGNEKRDEC